MQILIAEYCCTWKLIFNERGQISSSLHTKNSSKESTIKVDHYWYTQQTHIIFQNNL